MDEEHKRLLKTLSVVSSLGFAVVLAIAIGILIGLKLDQWLGTKPWFFFIFLLIGIVAAFRNIFIIIGKEIRNSEKGEDRRK
jgi:F0F1-type ATP synthase assembly protein I